MEVPLGAVNFSVEGVAFVVANDLTIEVNLVQVAGAVVEPVEVFAVGQLGLDAVAQEIVVVTQFTNLTTGSLDAFAEEAA